VIVEQPHGVKMLLLGRNLVDLPPNYLKLAFIDHIHHVGSNPLSVDHLVSDIFLLLEVGGKSSQ